MTDKKLLSFDETGFQWAWDSTSLSSFVTCPRKYYYSMLQGWTAQQKSVHLIFGGHYASALEHFHKHRAAGVDYDTALRLVVREALEATWDYEKDAPQDWMHTSKTRDTLIRSIVWYLEHYRDDPMQTVILSDGRAAVEYSFSIDLDETYTYCGHIDRLVNYGGDIYVQDQKAQPLSENILTPGGWRPLGSLAVGDLVVGVDGGWHSITDILPKGEVEIFEVHFVDGTSTRCAWDHLWGVYDQFGKYAVLSMQEMATAPKHKKFRVPLVAPVQHPTADLPLAPLALGLLLGDGYLAGSSVQFSDADGHEAAMLAAVLPAGDKIKKSASANHSWIISGGGTKRALQQLGLFGKLSGGKFIPESYLVADESQRRALLRGLLETDGHNLGTNWLYDSTSEQLVKDICQLVRSLGGMARYHTRSGNAFRAHLRMPEWGNGVGSRYIKRVVKLPYVETAACLKVSAPRQLYVTESYIVTHNTTGSQITPRFFEGYSPDYQMTGYTWAGQIIFNMPVKGVVIDAAYIAVGFTAFGRQPVTRSDRQLEEFRTEVLHYIGEAKRCHESGYYPMDRTACGNYGGCEFKQICSAVPGIRQNLLEGGFKHRDRWDPLARR